MGVFITMNMYFDGSPTAYLNPDDPSLQAFAKVAEAFGDATAIILLLEREDLPMHQALAEIASITEALEKIDFVTRVDSVMNAARISRGPGLGVNIQHQPYVTYKDEEYHLDERIFTDSLYAGNLIAQDGSIFSLMVRKDDMVTMESHHLIDQLVQTLETRTTMRYSILGEVVVNYEIFQSLNVMTFSYPPLILLIILILYFWKLRNIYLSFLTLVPPMLSAVWVLFFMLLFGRNMNSLTVMIPSFILIVGSAYGMHFLTRWVENASSGMNHSQLVKGTRKDEITPIYFSALTTMAGFSSYIFINSQAFRDMGIFVSLGVFLSSFFTITLIPHMASVPKKPVVPSQKEARILKTFLLYKRPFFWATIIVLAISPLLISRIPLEVDQYVFFRQSSPTVKASKKMLDAFGWITPYTLMIERKDSDLFYITTDESAQLENALESISGLSSIAHTQSIWDISQRLNLPAPLLIGLLRASGDQMAKTLLTPEALRIMMMSSESDSTNAALTQQHVKQVLSEYPELTDTFSFTLASAALIWESLNSTVVINQVQSLILAFGLILLLLLFIFRSLKIAMLSTIPILVTVLFNFMFMSIFQIPLQISTAIISGMLMGLIIDYSIHFMVWWRREKNAQKALEKTSPPILANSLSLMASFAILLTAPLLLYLHVSILMILSIGVGMVSTLFFMPAMLHDKNETVQDELTQKGAKKSRGGKDAKRQTASS